MNHRYMGVLLAGILAGCNAAPVPAESSHQEKKEEAVQEVQTEESASSVPVSTPEPAETPAEPEKSLETDAEAEYAVLPSAADPSAQPVIWTHAPDLGLTYIEELRVSGYPAWEETVFHEKTGYPQEWDKPVRDILEEYIAEYGSTESFTCQVYDTDAIAVYGENTRGVYDYQGNALTELSETGISEKITYFPPASFDLLAEGFEDKYSYLSDYRTMIRTANLGGFGGTTGMGYAVINGELVHGETINDYQKTDQITGGHGTHFLVKILEQDGTSMGKQIGYAAYEGSRHMFDILGEEPLCYVNGFCSFSSGSEFIGQDYRKAEDKLAFRNMSTGDLITEYIYDDAKWFEDGFCPVKRDGHWGFINEDGTEVTDMIWDDVSALYDGKAYVGIDGTYGILDLLSTLAEIPHITLSNCYPDGLKRAEMIPPGEIDNDMLGAAVVLTEGLNIRKGPGTDAAKDGHAEYLRSYPVYEITETGGYTWYRITEDQWIADQNGSWVRYYPNKTE